jgi:murein DD-endopeptidase MepM/ murein hydrolase activator NlpD
LQAYTRLGLYDKADGLTEVVWSVDSMGRVAGFSIRAPQSAHPSRFDDYQTRTALRLPFAGPWFVVWGGRSLKDKPPCGRSRRRFATGLHHAQWRREPRRGRHHERAVLRLRAADRGAGPGTVVQVVNDVSDNVPGTPNHDELLGNYVVIDHGDGEFSFLGHLEHGSVTVRKDQKVKAGQPLARCGNSGSSIEPQLHYHLQTTGKRFAGEGLPAQFSAYRADGAPVPRGEPQQMQTVEQP